MRRTIKNPRVVLLDCNLEYKKGESQTNMEMTKETDMYNYRSIQIFYFFYLLTGLMLFNKKWTKLLLCAHTFSRLSLMSLLLKRVFLVCLAHYLEIDLIPFLFSDLAQHFLMKGNVSILRRVRKTDNNRIARVTGATIVNRPEEIEEKDVGTACGLFDVRKIGDDYFSYFVECKDPKACTIMLRGASKDVSNCYKAKY